MTIAANPETDPRVIKAEIRDEALTLGFDAIGFAQAGSDPADRTRLAEFVKAGYHGDMAWMARDDGRRGDPKALMPTVESIIVLGVNYGPGQDPMAVMAHPERGAVSVYDTRNEPGSAGGLIAIKDTNPFVRQKTLRSDSRQEPVLGTSGCVSARDPDQPFEVSFAG